MERDSSTDRSIWAAKPVSRLADEARAAADPPNFGQTSLAPGLPCYGEPLRAMTGKYRARNPVLVTALALLDLLGKLHPRRRGRLPDDRPLRVLVANWAHLGDVVAMLPLLQFLAGQSRIGEIGVLVGSWSRCIVSDLPFVGKIHCLDHFLLDRAPDSKAKKIRNYFARQRMVVNEIRNSHYDVSIDLFTVFPPTHRLLWKAGIPTRIGFSCTGLGSYLTHPVEWPTDDEYVLTKQLRLLQPIFGADAPKTLTAVYPGFVPSPLADNQLSPGRGYVLMHMGVGDYRSWPLSNWLALGRALKERGKDIVFTGAKGSEAAMASQVAAELGAQCVAGNAFVERVRDIGSQRRRGNLRRYCHRPFGGLLRSSDHHIAFRPLGAEILSSEQRKRRNSNPSSRLLAMLSVCGLRGDGLRKIHFDRRSTLRVRPSLGPATLIAGRAQ